ncbi:flagellar M-ring protein FliF [Nocardioides sp. Root190]|uniref:flagellar basal-body MS-ring/collar protein FliF n=1 Tax=Nocardioides sp. Root190 TaxID=1736488 RepID=UPI0006FDBD4B|nr:flagellar basal-body MS-ring/collar protein FliF [Nocardioides sp. Root190]KRB79955.1 flagellar M-ring protein FliF [Nocardioides sp. Root190]
MAQTVQQRLTGALGRGRDTFSAFTAGQKAVALVGTAALLVAVFLVFRWVSAPSYAPLYSNLSGEDASAVIEELDSQGIPYEISGGGGTIMVPRADVYSSRIALSGKGLPASSDGGYNLLDNQSLSTSESQERTNFKRAMEGELSKTIEAIDGVETAVVHLAMPEKQVFSDEQDPATASVLVDTSPGTDVDDEQVQAIIHLVASSIDGLDPKNVTVTDSTGTLLTANGSASGSGAASARAKEVQAFQDAMQAKIQADLDKWVGVGNSTVTVTADLDLDKATINSRTYDDEKKSPKLSESRNSETYTGPAGTGTDGAGGVVGPDGQMDPGAAAGNGDSSYANTSQTSDYGVDEKVETRESAPGTVKRLNLGIALDATAAAKVQPAVIEDQIASAVGLQADRGDTIEVSVLPFDQSAKDSAAKELAAAAAAAAADRKNTLLRNLSIGGGIMLMVLLAWWQARRRSRAREEATSYVVEQLRLDAANRTPVLESPALAALESSESDEEESMRDELIALVDNQPDDVASLLRGWLVEPRP